MGQILVHFRGQQDLQVGQTQGLTEREISCSEQLAGWSFPEMGKTVGE